MLCYRPQTSDTMAYFIVEYFEYSWHEVVTHPARERPHSPVPSPEFNSRSLKSAAERPGELVLRYLSREMTECTIPYSAALNSSRANAKKASGEQPANMKKYRHMRAYTRYTMCIPLGFFNISRPGYSSLPFFFPLNYYTRR